MSGRTLATMRAQLLGGGWAEVVIAVSTNRRPCRIARELGGQQLGGQQRSLQHGAAPGVHQLGAAHEGIAGGHLTARARWTKAGSA